MLSKRIISYLLLVLNTVVWGAALVVVKPSLEITTPFRYLLYRFIIASVLILPVIWYYCSKIKNIQKKLVSIIAVELLGTTIALGLLYAGLSHTSALEASLLTSSTPIFTVLAGIWYLREREESREVVGLVLAAIGTLVLVLLPLFLGNDHLVVPSVNGNLLIIGQNIATASYFVLAKKHYKKLPKLFVTGISFFVGAVSFAVLSLGEVGFSLNSFLAAVRLDLSAPSVWLASIYMALFGSIIGLTAYIKGQDGIEASEASLFGYLQPIVYIPLAVWFLGDVLYWQQLVGLGLVLVGVVVAERRAKKRKAS